MVVEGNTVVAAPLHGQKDNLVIVGVGGVVGEGNYNTWTHKWHFDIELGVSSGASITFFTDDLNKILYIDYTTNVSPYGIRFGVYDLTDGSKIHLSASDEYYYDHNPSCYNARWVMFGHTNAASGGMSRSIQTYLLLLRSGREIIEVWRNGGTSPLWSRDITLDTPEYSEVSSFEISPTGKYIVIYNRVNVRMECYEGSYVEP